MRKADREGSNIRSEKVVSPERTDLLDETQRSLLAPKALTCIRIQMPPGEANNLWWPSKVSKRDQCVNEKRTVGGAPISGAQTHADPYMHPWDTAAAGVA